VAGFRPILAFLSITTNFPIPLIYDPHAKCDIFLGSFLAHILEPADIDLLQRYLSQVLEGINHSQTILVVTGDAGWGKSSLLKILGSMVGWRNVGIIREQLFRDEFELAHYYNKNFLFHPDMPTDFLDRKEASIFKQLVGGDPLWANVKGDDGRLVIEGHYPVILACNGKPRIHLDSDTDAWMRRLVVLSLKTPTHEQHFGKMAELILKTESAGILNWLLEGRTKLAKDKLQLTQTPEQKERAATLLLASDSPAAFVRACLVKKRDAELGVVDLYEHYQEWCRGNHVRPFASRPFTATAKEEIEIAMGMKLRHDLASDTRPRRDQRPHYRHPARPVRGRSQPEPGRGYPGLSIRRQPVLQRPQARRHSHLPPRRMLPQTGQHQ
jgi:putative DNA primase/helicase